MKPGSRRDRWVVGAVAVLLVGAFARTQCVHAPPTTEGSGAAGAMPPVAVGLGRVERLQRPVVELAPGTVRSARQVVLSARLIAQVLEVRVRAGDTVVAGDVLVVLDDRDLQAEVARAQAEGEAREQVLVDATTELERTRRLLARDAATAQQLDRAVVARAGAAAAREAATQSLAAARARLADAVVVAPFDGIVQARSVDPGDMALPGRELLGLYDPDALQAQVAVGEGSLSGLAPGTGLEVELAGGGGPLRGVVAEVVPAVDPSTRTALVKLDLPAGAPARPGGFVRVAVPHGSRTALAVPAAALVRRGQLELVFESVRGAGAEGPHAALKLVRAGEPFRRPDRPGDWVEILAGVDEGAEVVVQGAAGLVDGAALRPGARPARGAPAEGR